MCIGVLRVNRAEFWPKQQQQFERPRKHVIYLFIFMLKLSGHCKDLLLLFLGVNVQKCVMWLSMLYFTPYFIIMFVLSSFCIVPGSQTPKRAWRPAAKGNASSGKNTPRESDAIEAKKVVSKVERWNRDLEPDDHRGLLFLCLFSRSCDHRGRRALGYTGERRGEQEVWWSW